MRACQDITSCWFFPWQSLKKTKYTLCYGCARVFTQRKLLLAQKWSLRLKRKNNTNISTLQKEICFMLHKCEPWLFNSHGSSGQPTPPTIDAIQNQEHFWHRICRLEVFSLLKSLFFQRKSTRQPRRSLVIDLKTRQSIWLSTGRNQASKKQQKNLLGSSPGEMIFKFWVVVLFYFFK